MQKIHPSDLPLYSIFNCTYVSNTLGTRFLDSFPATPLTFAGKQAQAKTEAQGPNQTQRCLTIALRLKAANDIGKPIWVLLVSRPGECLVENLEIRHFRNPAVDPIRKETARAARSARLSAFEEDPA